MSLQATFFEHKNDDWPKQDHVASAMYMLMELKHDDIKGTAIVGVVLRYETSSHRESPRYRPHPKATIWVVVDGNPVTCSPIRRFFTEIDVDPSLSGLVERRFSFMDWYNCPYYGLISADRAYDLTQEMNMMIERLACFDRSQSRYCELLNRVTTEEIVRASLAYTPRNLNDWYLSQQFLEHDVRRDDVNKYQKLHNLD